jgi:chlorophyllide a reductase subunit Z
LWESGAQEVLQAYLETQPFLVRISAAKALRDLAEREARDAGEHRITAERVTRSRSMLAAGRVA